MSNTRVWRGGVLRAIFYAFLLGVLSFLTQYAFEVVDLLEPFSQYMIYVQGGLVIVLGYKVVSSASDAVFKVMMEVSDKGTAGSIRTMTRIGGIAVILSVLTSVFKVNPSAALTVGSFSGLVVGFATQNVLTQAVAGLFLAISRPFQVGDEITVANQTGIVKDIKIMQTVLQSSDNSKEVLIPNNTVFGAIITKQIKKTQND